MKSLRKGPKVWLAVLAIAVVAPLSACGSSAGNDAGDGRAGQDDVAMEAIDSPDQSSDASDGDLPSGFPADFPLPQGASVSEVKVAVDGMWQMIPDTGAQDGDEYLDRYAQQLEKAGFEIKGLAGGGLDAHSSSWDVGATVSSAVVGESEMMLTVTQSG